MLLTVLERDLKVVEQSHFRLKNPYKMLIEETIKGVRRGFADVKRYMYKNKIKVEEMLTEYFDKI